jgi:hypothetical protein
VAKVRKPNFLIVGVQKAGTTFLAKHLAEHPDVFFSNPKEILFFNCAEVAPADFKVYLFENFQVESERKWVGEGSTEYFHHGKAIKHIEQYLGKKVRIMVCLRHPIERLFSHYLHDYRKSRLTGAEALSDPAWDGYRSRSYYAERLNMWESTFPRFRPLIFDDLVRSGSLYYRQAAEFLHIEPQPIADRPVNEGLRMVWQGDELTISSAPGAGQTSPRFRREEVEALSALYRDDVKRTMDILDRDLSAWLKLPDFGQINQKFGRVS